MIGNSDDEIKFPHKLLLTNRQVANLRKAFSSYLSTDIKLSKIQLLKKIQSITKNSININEKCNSALT